MSIELYHADYSTCSQKVRIALAEKKIPYESKVMDFSEEDQLKPEYLAINPNGVVPTLTHNGEVILDSSCIMEYVDETFPETPLSPATSLGRARMRAWMRYMEEVPTVAIRMPSFEQVFLPTMRMVGNEETFDKSRAKRTLRKGFYGKMNSGKGFAQSDIDNSMDQLKDTINRMESALANRPWILGEQFSLVDVGLVPLIDRMNDLGLDYLWSNTTHFKNWLQRIQSRPSFQQAFYKGSRLSERAEYEHYMKQTRRQNMEKARKHGVEA